MEAYDEQIRQLARADRQSGPDAARPTVNAPVKGEVKRAPEQGTAPLKNSAKHADKPAAKKIPAEKSR